METAVAITTEAVEEAAGVVASQGISTGDALVKAVLGYAVVFTGLALLMLVIIVMGRIMISRERKSAIKSVVPAPAPAQSAVPVTASAPVISKKLAPGSAGEVKIYDTDPRDAAMIMAIVANKLGKPLNELRFVSIKEVK